MAKITQFLREVKGELQKVVWPNKREALKMTGVVILFSVAVAIFLGLVDIGLQYLLEFLVNQ